MSGQDPALPSTPATILGPFYPLRKPSDKDSDLTRIAGKGVRAKGQVIEIAGRVLNQLGNPVRNAQVELWQANALGRYSHYSDPNPAALDLRCGRHITSQAAMLWIARQRLIA